MSAEKKSNKDKDKDECCDCCDDNCCNPKEWRKHHHHDHGSGGAIYFFGLVGAAVYFVQQVSGFWPVVLAILKAIAWPAFLIYKAFVMLHM